MKIFLTGGTGFIGSHFINYAHDCGHEIIAVLRSKDSLPRVELKKNPTWVQSRLDNPKLKSHLSKCDVVVHLASHSANKPYDSYLKCMHHNFFESTLFMYNAIDAGIKKFIVAGTCFEYGKSSTLYNRIPTHASLEPMNSYAKSKAAFYAVCSSIALEKKVQIIYPRIFQVFGEGEYISRLWPSLKVASLEKKDYTISSASLIRDFINVHDVAQKLVSYIDKNIDNKGEVNITHIATGKGQTVGNFALYWWKKWGSTGRLILNDNKNNSDIQRIVAEI